MTECLSPAEYTKLSCRDTGRTESKQSQAEVSNRGIENYPNLHYRLLHKYRTRERWFALHFI